MNTEAVYTYTVHCTVVVEAADAEVEAVNTEAVYTVQ